MKQKKYLIGGILLAILCLPFLRTVRVTFLEAYRVPSSSMEDTILLGDHILLNKLSYGIYNPVTERRFVNFESPRRGDVVAFIYTEDPSRTFLKRIIGLPGEKLEIKDKQVYINDAPISEPYKVHKAEFMGLAPQDFGPVTVPEKYYFVLGDNRENSKDSRAWGYIPYDYLLGKAVMVYFSYERGKGFRWSRFWKRIS